VALPGLVLTPLVVGPSQVPDDPAPLAGEPEIAVPAALTHGRTRHEMLHVFATALGRVETELALLHLRLARERIAACSDLDLLDAWHDRAVTAETVDDLGV
jgi:hypothetical protein